MQWLTFRLGNDKHFIGDGYRSLLLSENAAAYPFLETKLAVWKIQYNHQINVLSDLLPGRGSERFTKYISNHTLQYRVSPRIHIYLFEAVIWRETDSAKHYRGFDITYLNPFIFYRPAEFNIGSPDNVIKGFGGRIRIGKRNFLYSQLMLDEFRLKEIKANNGWWANKYAYQLGFKTYGLFKHKPSLLQFEYNHCRPFTYAHTLSLQNYGYLNRPLAHPQGSNFREFAGVFRVSFPKNWSMHLTGSYLVYGNNPPGLNLGADIYSPQKTFTKTNGNYTGQGIAVKQLNCAMVLSRMIVPAWRLHAFGEIHLRGEQSLGKTTMDPLVRFGVSTLLYE